MLESSGSGFRDVKGLRVFIHTGCSALTYMSLNSCDRRDWIWEATPGNPGRDYRPDYNFSIRDRQNSFRVLGPRSNIFQCIASVISLAWDMLSHCEFDLDKLTDEVALGSDINRQLQRSGQPIYVTAANHNCRYIRKHSPHILILDVGGMKSLDSQTIEGTSDLNKTPDDPKAAGLIQLNAKAP